MSPEAPRPPEPAPETGQPAPSTRRALAAVAIVSAVTVAAVIIYRAQVVSSPSTPPVGANAPVSVPAVPPSFTDAADASTDGTLSAIAAPNAPVPQDAAAPPPAENKAAPLPRVHFSGSKAFVPSGQGLFKGPDGAVQQGADPADPAMKRPLEFVVVPSAPTGAATADRVPANDVSAPASAPARPAPRVFFSGSKSKLPSRPARPAGTDAAPSPAPNQRP